MLLNDAKSIMRSNLFWTLLKAVREADNRDDSVEKCLISLLDYMATEAGARYNYGRQFTFQRASPPNLEADVSIYTCFPVGTQELDSIGPDDWRAGFAFVKIKQGTQSRPPSAPRFKESSVVEGPQQEGDGQPPKDLQELSSSMLASCTARRHVFGLHYARQESSLSFSFTDRGGAIIGGPVYLDDDSQVETMIAALLGFFSNQKYELGLHESFGEPTPNIGRAGIIFQDLSKLCVHIEPWTFQIERPVDLGAFHDDVFRTTRYLAKRTAGPPWVAGSSRDALKHGLNDVVLSFRWGPDASEEDHGEDQWHYLASEREISRVAKIYRSHVFPEQDYPGWVRTTRERLCSMLCVSIMEPFIQLDEVKDVGQFKKAFISLVEGS